MKTQNYNFILVSIISLIYSILIIPNMILFFFFNYSSYSVLYIILELSYILFLINYILFGFRFKVYFLSLISFTLLLPGLLSIFYLDNYVISLLYGILGVLFGISFLFYSTIFRNFKRIGYLAIGSNILLIFNTFLFFSNTSNQIIINSLFVGILVFTGIFLDALFYFFQYKFFSELYNQTKGVNDEYKTKRKKK